MQEIKKRRIVIASVLKPVDDSRMFEKLGVSLAKEHEVWIVGFKGSLHNYANLYQIPLAHFTRLSLGRILAPWRVMRRTWGLHPDIVIIATHELLFQALLLKLVRRCKLVYDVQENYYRNILHTNAFPKFIRPLLAGYVRLCERLSSPFIDHYLLAEEGYQSEIRFPARKTTVIANKYSGPVKARDARKDRLRLLFSGTISESTGVFRAIDLAEKIHRVDPRATLTIIGSCSLPEELEKLKKAIHQRSYVRLIGGDHLVPHGKIVEAIQDSDAGIIAYEVTPATENSHPTKLYEYAANGLPVFVYNHQPWVKLILKWNAGIVYDDMSDGAVLLQTFENQSFYPESANEALWTSEEHKLLKLFRQF